MAQTLIQQRCWNHETREAVCRCPQCGRSFCRECVTEHEARLLCALCLQAMTRGGGQRRRRAGRWLPAGLALAGILLAWGLFFAGGEALLLFTQRIEQTQERGR